MSGINLYERLKTFSEFNERQNRTKPCIFISYQRCDEAAAADVADELMSNDIDVYFDLQDRQLIIHRENNNSEGLTNSILQGIEESTHMLCIISENTRDSMWVPFEIGYGYDKPVELFILTLKDFIDNDPPQYFHAVKDTLEGTESLDRFIQRVGPRALFETRLYSIRERQTNHPLRHILKVGR